MAANDWGELRASVEALALGVVMDLPSAPDTDWLAGVTARLGEVEESARAGGAEAAASVAHRLREQMDAGGMSWGQKSQGLERGLTELAAALVRAERPAAEPVANALAQDQELLGDFVSESRDHLNAVESGVLELEQNARNSEVIHAIFRGFHTIKGLAGFLELGEIREVAHEVESLLGLAREGAFEITPDSIDVILAAADFLEQWIKTIESQLAGRVAEPPAGYRALLDRVLALRSAGEAPRAETTPSSAPDTAPASQAVATPPAEPPPVATVAPAQPAAKESPGSGSAAPPASGGEHRSVKVHTGKLDYLVDMVGELVIAQSLVRHDPDLAAMQRPRLQHNLSQLARITDEVQRTAMSMRMVQVGPLFQKMSRLVRDLGRKTGKQAELETAGETTELDRTIVEQLHDPLMHMVRNSLDHGIETPEERVAAGKNPVARVKLAARHESGHIVIEVGDDGRGLNQEKILAKARRNGLVAAGASLTEQEIYGLIFQPGFSTAEQVTDVSGRGVGMDVVKRNVQKLRGRIEVHSTPGGGTTFQLKLPLTLAIIDGLVVRVGRERYIVPIFAVKEIVHATPDILSTVENRMEMALVRGQLIPVVRLAERFRLSGGGERPPSGLLIVTSSTEHRFGLMVDELIGKQEVVIKSLGDTFKNVVGIAGGAILGDGCVGLILDLETIFGGGARGGSL